GPAVRPASAHAIAAPHPKRVLMTARGLAEIFRVVDVCGPVSSSVDETAEDAAAITRLHDARDNAEELLDDVQVAVRAAERALLVQAPAARALLKAALQLLNAFRVLDALRERPAAVFRHADAAVDDGDSAVETCFDLERDVGLGVGRLAVADVTVA